MHELDDSRGSPGCVADEATDGSGNGRRAPGRHLGESRGSSGAPTTLPPWPRGYRGLAHLDVGWRGPGEPLAGRGLGPCYRAVMVDSVALPVADLVGDLTGADAFVDCADAPSPDVRSVPTAVGDLVGLEA